MEQNHRAVDFQANGEAVKKVLIVDDDAIMRKLVEQIVLRSGNKFFSAQNGTDGLNQFYAHRPDLVILDITMPMMSGWEVCRHIRQFSNVPIIMLTAMGGERDIVRGLQEGADDYVTKPFNANILQARIQAALRRSALPAVKQPPTLYNDDHLTLDLTKRRMLVAGNVVKLTATEYRLLCYLFQNAGRVLTFRQILENVWGWEYRDHTDYVHVYVWHLRKKLEEDPKMPKYILTEHGVGYRFEKAVEPSPATPLSTVQERSASRVLS
jgi:two-component system KDP operon response regulator KdpE